MNWIFEATLLFAGALLGYFVPHILKATKLIFVNTLDWFERKAMEKSRSKNWFIQYYKDLGLETLLYQTTDEGEKITIPFLTLSKWENISKVKLENHNIIRLNGKTKRNFPIKKDIIRRKRLKNQEIFNEPTLYVEKVHTNPLNGEVNLFCRYCSYYELISSIGMLESETRKSINRKKFVPPIRRKYFTNISDNDMEYDQPFSVGCTFLLSVDDKGVEKFLIQKRSSKTATYGGFQAVIPSFGLTPRFSPEKDARNIIYYNFIKEYCEELFDYEELNRFMINKRGSADWFYNLDEAKEFESVYQKGGISFYYLGFGIDVKNGTHTLAYMCRITDQEYISTLKSSIKGNWETEDNQVDSYDTFENLAFYNSESDIFKKWLENNQLHFGSAFTIFQAKKMLKDLN